MLDKLLTTQCALEKAANCNGSRLKTVGLAISANFGSN